MMEILNIIIKVKEIKRNSKSFLLFFPFPLSVAFFLILKLMGKGTQKKVFNCFSVDFNFMNWVLKNINLKGSSVKV